MILSFPFLSRASRAWAVTGLAAALAAAGPARADGKNECNDAYARAQTLRDGRKFSEAIVQLRLCAAPSCAKWMVKDCLDWLDDAQKRQPSIVFVAQDEGGAMVDVAQVTDAAGKEWSQSLDGKSIAVDPGRYEFVFVARSGEKMTVTAIVPEGQKSFGVKAVFPKPKPNEPPKAAAVPSAAPPLAAAPVPSSAPPHAERKVEGASSWGSRRLVGVTATLLGAGAAALGTVLWIDGQHRYNNPPSLDPIVGCSGGRCDADVASARSRIRVGVGLAIGGAVVGAGGAVLWLTAPKAGSAARIGLGPSGFVLAGEF